MRHKPLKVIGSLATDGGGGGGSKPTIILDNNLYPSDMGGCPVSITDSGNMGLNGSFDIDSLDIASFSAPALTSLSGGTLSILTTPYTLTDLNTVANGGTLTISDANGTLPPIGNITGGDGTLPNINGQGAIYNIHLTASTYTFSQGISISGGTGADVYAGGSAAFNISGTSLTSITFSDNVTFNTGDDSGSGDPSGGLVTMSLRSMTALTSVTFSGGISMNYGAVTSDSNATLSLDLSGCALTSDCIDALTAVLLTTQTNQSASFMYVDVSGGTSATASSTALANIAAIQLINPNSTFVTN